MADKLAQQLTSANISDVTDIIADVGITARQIRGFTALRIQSSTAGACTITAVPQIEAGKDGQILILHGSDDTKTVIIHDGDGIVLSNDTKTINAETSLMFQYIEDEEVWREIKISVVLTDIDSDADVGFNSLKDTTRVVDADNTLKGFKFDAGGLTPSTTPTYTMPDYDVDFSFINQFKDTTASNDGGHLVVDNSVYIEKQAYVPTTVALVDGATIDVDASLGNVFEVVITGNREINEPTNPSDGQLIRFRIVQDNSGNREITWNAIFDFGSATVPTLSTTGDLTDVVAFEYSSSTTKWEYRGCGLGYGA